MVQLLPWQWALIALAIVIFLSLGGLGIYLFWRKQKKPSNTTKSGSVDRPQRIIERNIHEDGEELKKKSRASVIKRLSPRFPSLIIIQQQKQLYNQPNSGSVMMVPDSNIAIDIEKTQHHLVMMPLSAPPPRTRRVKPKLICAKQQSQSKHAKDNNSITTGGSNSNTNNSDAAHQESSLSLSPPFLSANTGIAMKKRGFGDEKNLSKTRVVDDDHDHEKDQNEDENNIVVPMTITTSIDSGTPSPTLAVAEGPFVLTPFIGSPTTTPTSTSGRSTSERIIVNSVHNSLRSNNSNNSGTMLEQLHQQQRQRYNSSTTSSSNYVLACSTIIDRPSSSCNHSNRSSSGSGGGGSPSDNQLQQLPYSIKPLSTNSNTSWRGPTPPWTLLRNNSTINNNNKPNNTK